MSFSALPLRIQIEKKRFSRAQGPAMKRLLIALAQHVFRSCRLAMAQEKTARPASSPEGRRHPPAQ